MKTRIHIYIIYFPTSKKYYIGQTIDLERRLIKQHLNADSFVGKALRKYDDWIIKKLHTCKTHDEANRIEIEEIRNFNCIVPNGYNLTIGGEGASGGHWNWSEESKEKQRKAHQGRKHSEETIKKMEIAKIGNQNAKGFKHSEKWKKENSKRTKGRKNPNAHSVQAEFKRLKTRLEKLEQDL